jgi:hypothetical protein
MNSEVLSICIPTTLQRLSIFKTVKSILKETKSKPVVLEIFVNVRMPLTFRQNLILFMLKQFKVRLAFHKEFFPTAEMSAFNAAKKCVAPWVWIIGDDDTITKGSIDHVLNLIAKDLASFWLLNFIPKVSGRKTRYIQVGPLDIQVGKGSLVWSKLGIASAMTTLSCFLLERNKLNLARFSEYHESSPIYSHSAALLAEMFNKNVGISDFFCVLRNEESAEKVQQAIEKLPARVFFFQIEGLISLLLKVSRETRIPLEVLLTYREIELVKDETFGTAAQKVLVSDTGDLILRAYERRLACSGGADLTRGYAEILTFLKNRSINRSVYQVPVRVTL